jgi:hypothetical protein
VTDQIIGWKSQASEDEKQQYDKLLELSQRSPLPPKEVLANLGLYLNRSSMSRLMFMHEIYRKIVDTQGIVMEFGTRWGQNLALFTTFRHMYEPYNLSRAIVGFDTFEGFPTVSDKDGSTELTRVGALSVTRGYESFLEELLATHERLAPRSNVRKYELVKGDVTVTLPRYLEEHPETIIALAYFDLDLYEPTRQCLELIRPYLTRGSIVGFDELGLREFPGETQALREAWGLGGFRVHRSPISVQQSYVTFD